MFVTFLRTKNVNNVSSGDVHGREQLIYIEIFGTTDNLCLVRIVFNADFFDCSLYIA